MEKGQDGVNPSRRQERGMVEGGKEREERLAEALRANLRRRKAQARERQEPPPNDGEAGSRERG